ncbi:MAG: AmmeMemoRadiSam system protein B [Candidatus Aenigmarchaeota archaeon]|nr:AmmeMemoRadiSam system protein B [Candidatus Aenigmarchaeota archaeon]
MITRNPVAAGYFYPLSPSDLKTTIEKFLRRARVEKEEILGAVVPHAGYIYCGETQAHVYKTLIENPTFIIIGPNHTGMGAEASIMCEGIWKTPLGSCRIDTEIARKILDGSEYLREDLYAHTQEHSIEVQLPWLQYRFGNVKFVPIVIGSNNPEVYKDVGNAIKNAIKATKSIVIASSDFTHYGEVYGYTPIRGGPSKVLRYIESIDMEAARAISDRAPERFLEVVERYKATICGKGAIATMLYALKDDALKGTLLHYSTSYQISRSLDAVVGYAGIIIQ